MKLRNKATAILFFGVVFTATTLCGLLKTRANRGVPNWAEITKDKEASTVQVFTYESHYDIFEPHRPPQQSGCCGSGFFISADGYILTNFHVIEDACNNGAYITTTLTGKERFEVKVVGGCPQRDVALLKMTPDSLTRFQAVTKKKETPALILGDSDAVNKADSIILLGHPGGEADIKITIGYVKGFQDSIIETTAPVNHGDSGGPFFDENGEVIGLCVAKKVDSECYGIIIPINNVTMLFDALEKNKIVRLPAWGLVTIPTIKSTRDYLKCPEEGVYLAKVIVDSLGDTAGFKVGDIIVAVNDKKIDESGEMFVEWSDEKVGVDDYLNRLPIDSTVTFAFFREGKRQELSLKATLRETSGVDYYYLNFEKKPDYEIFGGMVVSQLTKNHLAELLKSGNSLDATLLKYVRDEEKKDQQRIIITSIFNTSMLHLSRAFPFRVALLKKINQVEVNTVDEFRNAVLLSKETGFLTIETEHKAFVALPLKELLEEEERLSMVYGYKPSELIELLK